MLPITLCGGNCLLVCSRGSVLRRKISSGVMTLADCAISRSAQVLSRSHGKKRWVFMLLTQIFRTNRQLPDALPGRGENRVSDSRNNLRRTGLSDPTRRVLARNDVHFHHWHLVDSQDVVFVEIGLLHASAIDRYSAL